MIQNKQSGVRGQKPGDSGFTLIETIITLVVLSIAAVGVLSVFTVGIKGSANPLVVDQAVQLAQERMDTIIGDRENVPPTGTRGFAWIVPGNYNASPGVAVPGFMGFTRSESIYCVTAADLITSIGSPGVGGCASGYTHVTVTVANALIGSVSVETIVTNY
jgi:prepilin-type N-terminal cleavage/methylation domain-containing protein